MRGPYCHRGIAVTDPRSGRTLRGSRWVGLRDRTPDRSLKGIGRVVPLHSKSFLPLLPYFSNFRSETASRGVGGGSHVRARTRSGLEGGCKGGGGIVQQGALAALCEKHLCMRL